VAVTITQTITGPSSVNAKPLESTVSLAFAGLTASTNYAVTVGQPGGMLTPTTPLSHTVIVDGAQGASYTFYAKTDGAGAMTVKWVPPSPGTWTVKCYPVLTSMTDAASGIAGNTIVVTH